MGVPFLSVPMYAEAPGLTRAYIAMSPMSPVALLMAAGFAPLTSTIV